MGSREDRKKEITRQRQQQIMEAALPVFSRLGYDGANMSDIAREAGIAVGTIYNYYSSKRDLLIAITNRYIIEPFAAIVKRPLPPDDVTFVAAIIENRLNFGMGNLDKFIPLLIEVQRDPELRRRYTEEVIQPIMGFMEKLIQSRIDYGAFRDVAPAIVTRAAAGMIIGFMLLYSIEGERSPVYNIDRKKLTDVLTELVLGAIRK